MVSPIKKLVRDKQALEWLRKHRAELGGLTAALPHHQSYFRSYLIEQKFVADLIAAAMPYRNPLYQRVAELYLTTSPRKVAETLKLSRKRIYDVIYNLKRIARAKWEQEREGLLNARDEAHHREPLETHPEYMALRTVAITLGETTKYAYLLEDGSWVDEDGKAFTDDICDILNNREEDLRDASVLEVEDV